MDEKYGSFANPYTYTGKELDSEVGLYYYGARYYNAGFSRFTSVDPALFDPQHLLSILADPQSLNSYAYARNNPIRFYDPNGADAVDWLNGFLHGAWNGAKTVLGDVWGMIKGAWSFGTNPIATSLQALGAAKNAISNYDAILNAIADEIYNSYDTLAFGTDYESGERAGELITEILVAIVATKGTEYLGKIAKDTSAVSNIISEAKGLKYFDEIVNNSSVATYDDAWAMAEKTLGKGYYEFKPGIFRSQDDLLQVRTRLGTGEIKKGDSPHINIERLEFQGIKESGEKSFKAIENKHIYYTEK